MRQITEDSINAFYRGATFSKQNMIVELSDSGEVLLKLHGNTIAKRDDSGALWITNAGWQTNTTKERLNALDGVSIHQRDFKWYLNGSLWDGEWIQIAEGEDEQSDRELASLSEEELSELFDSEMLPYLVEVYGLKVLDDEIMVNEEFNNWTDSLCKDGKLTDRQYNQFCYIGRAAS